MVVYYGNVLVFDEFWILEICVIYLDCLSKKRFGINKYILLYLSIYRVHGTL